MIVAGFGFRAAAGAESFAAALDAARRATGAAAPDALATVHDKAAALAPVAARLGLPLAAIPAAALTAQTTRTRSPTSLARYGTGSVAEAAALAAAGPGARLLGPRAVSPDRHVTCALAEAPGA